MFFSLPVHHNSIITRGGMMTGKLLIPGFPSLPSSSLQQSLRTFNTSRTTLAKNRETSDQRIARELESIAKGAIIYQSDSANFDNIIKELKHSCSTATDEKQQQDSAPSAPSSLKIKLPRFSDQYGSRTPPPVVLYGKYPLGDLLRYWFIYNEPYHHLGSDVPGINNFFRAITRGRISPLFDEFGALNCFAGSASYQMQRIADRVYPKVTIRDLAASKVSEAVPLRAFTLFDSFKNILTTDHSARIAQKNHVAPPGGSIVGTSVVRSYVRHWEYPDLSKYVFIVDGTAGSGKTIAALEMAHNRPHYRKSMNFSLDYIKAEDIVIYINVEDVYFRGKPWKEFGKARLEELYRQYILGGEQYSASRDCAYILKEALYETFDRILPSIQLKQDVNTEYRVVIVLDDMDRIFAFCLQKHAHREIVGTIQQKLFGPLPNSWEGDLDLNRVFRVSFIVSAPSIDEVKCSWPYNPLSAIIDLRTCCIKQSTLDHFSALEELQDENLAENLRLAEALCSNARCAALLSSALSDSNIQKQLFEAKKEDSAMSMKFLNKLLESIFLEVVRDYIMRSGLSKFQRPEKALLVALAISTFRVPTLPRTLEYCPLLRKSLKLVGENDDDDGHSESVMTNRSLYDLLVEETRLLIDLNHQRRFHFYFATSPAHLAMIHIILGIPFSAENFGDKPTSEKCFLISLVAPYFAEMKRAVFLEQFNVDVGLGQSVKDCLNTVRANEKGENHGDNELMMWSSVISQSETPAEYAVKEALVFDSIDLRGKPSDVFLFKNDLCMARDDIDDEEFEQRFEKLEKESNKKWLSSSNSTRNAFPVFIVCSAEEDTFPQVAVVAPGKVVLTREQKSSHRITTTVVKADDDDDKSLNNFLASCLDKGSSSNDSDESKKQQRSSTSAQIRYLRELQRIAQKLPS